MKICKYLTLTIIGFCGLLISDVQAETVNFEITADYTWNYDEFLRSSTKNNPNRYTAVSWEESSKSSHKMWFRVLDQADIEKGRMLFNYLTANAFETNLVEGHSYYLQARREHIINPITTVSGIWNA